MSRCVHRRYQWPIDPRGVSRCESEATHRILGSDGWRVPGGIYCERHARAIVEEYREKLGWEWTMVPIPEEER